LTQTEKPNFGPKKPQNPDYEAIKKKQEVRYNYIEGEKGLESKKKPGNALFRYERRKELTYEEQLQYQIEL